MFDFDADKVRNNARQSTTEDLLDRVTVYRDGMEPEAVEIIEEELERRGVARTEVLAHRAKAGRSNLLLDQYGLPLRCSFCPAPAVAEAWGWHRLWGKVPLFRRWFRYCEKHKPAG
jgi:hypothetical protein